METKKVAIIGAGASGIGVGKTLLEAGIEFEIIEATDRFGGNWQPDGPASKMYDSVHLISSKRNTQFSDFPMPEHYSNYPRHSLVFKYLENLAEHHGLRERTRFNTTVVQMSKDSEGWLLRFENGDESLYDLVVVCNGLLRTPKIPNVPGKFLGESIHASSYRSSEQFRGKRVLVVGSGNSGCDITVDAAQTAATAFHSVRRGYHYMPKFINGQPTQEWLMEEGAKFSNEEQYWAHVQSTFKLAGFDGRDYGLPAPDHKMEECHPIMNSQILYYIGHGDVLVKPQIIRFDDNTVHFSDGSSETIDMIVWATGYDISLPFLSNEVFDWRENMNSLFLRMVPAEHDDLLFVGYLNSPSGIGNLANIMSRFVSSYIQARTMKTQAWQALNQMKISPSSLDLGQQRFMKTSRHKYEVDLWKYIKAVNFVTAKLQSTTPV
jgi:cation diffusion facilitator CzcD-associated flavoprotein CzcO